MICPFQNNDGCIITRKSWIVKSKVRPIGLLCTQRDSLVFSFVDDYGSMPTGILPAVIDLWTLPRAKNCSPALNFCTSVPTGAALSSPFRAQKSRYPDGYLLFWYAYSYRIWGKSKEYQRFLQSDNSTFPSYKAHPPLSYTTFKFAIGQED